MFGFSFKTRGFEELKSFFDELPRNVRGVASEGGFADSGITLPTVTLPAPVRFAPPIRVLDNNVLLWRASEAAGYNRATHTGQAITREAFTVKEVA
jgi:hypothetical protein